MEELKIATFDGSDIYCYVFMPATSPKGVVQIVHGLEEHGLRYQNFAKVLNDNGYIAVATDQRLHGKTAGPNLSKTDIKDVFPVMLKDQIFISDMLLERFKLPLFIFGHSYGSFLVQKYIQVYHKHSGAILSGSGYMKRPKTLLAKMLAHLTVKLKGGREDSPFIENLVIGSFNKAIKDKGSWISLNEENVARYQADELCGVPLCANFYYSMFKNTRKLYKKENLNNIDADKNILLISGEDDPVGQMGKGVKKLQQTYAKLGINCTLKLYPALRHEVINEGKQEVLDDAIKFLNANIRT